VREVLFRCSSVGKLMAEPRSKSEVLSVSAKTYIRELVAQDLFGVDFEVSAKSMEKGNLVEPDAIALLNRVRGLSLVKNTERRSDGFLTGECDLFDAAARRGHDTKAPWSIATFPITEEDIDDKMLKLYEWQCRGYMRLWDADEWEVNWCLVNTPEHLIGYEPVTLHFVDHIPERMRLTTWAVKRDIDKEAAMIEKIKHARRYYAEVVQEFARTHGGDGAALREALAESIAEAA
jgi:hypothetical protein